MRPWRTHFGDERHAKNNEVVKIQQQQAAAVFNYFARLCRTGQKKNKKLGGGKAARSRCEYQIPGVHRLKEPRTNWRRGLLQKPATTRDRCVVRMLIWSCRDVQRPRDLLNAKTAALLQSHSDWTTKKKKSTSETPRPGRC